MTNMKNETGKQYQGLQKKDSGWTSSNQLANLRKLKLGWHYYKLTSKLICFAKCHN